MTGTAYFQHNSVSGFRRRVSVIDLLAFQRFSVQHTYLCIVWNSQRFELRHIGFQGYIQIFPFVIVFPDLLQFVFCLLIFAGILRDGFVFCRKGLTLYGSCIFRFLFRCRHIASRLRHCFRQHETKSLCQIRARPYQGCLATIIQRLKIVYKLFGDIVDIHSFDIPLPKPI